MLRNDEKAPDFQLICQRGDTHSPSTYAGKPLVLAFFRGSFCPTTQRSLAVWQDVHGRFKDMDANLIFISSDTTEKHAELAEKHGLTFPVVSDPGATVATAYGTYVDTYKDVTYSEPALFIINANGTIAYQSISTGPKGLPDPGAVLPMLVYMMTHQGNY